MTDVKTEFQTAVKQWADSNKEFIKSVFEMDLSLTEEGKKLLMQDFEPALKTSKNEIEKEARMK